MTMASSRPVGTFILAFGTLDPLKTDVDYREIWRCVLDSWIASFAPLLLPLHPCPALY